MKTITPTELRSNLYNLLDEVLKTGLPLEIKKGGKKLRIIPVEKVDKLSNLISRPDAIAGDPDDLAEIRWENELFISPIVRLELQYLYEVKRVRKTTDAIIADLSDRIGLSIDDRNFNAVVSQAVSIAWTSDPFDRLIVANAALNGNVLISKDQNIIAHYPHARC